MKRTIIIKLTVTETVSYGGIAQLARAFGSYPECRRFKSHYRYSIYGPVVKRLRHRPFTAETRVRFPFGSLYKRQRFSPLSFCYIVERQYLKSGSFLTIPSEQTDGQNKEVFQWSVFWIMWQFTDLLTIPFKGVCLDEFQKIRNDAM